MNKFSRVLNDLLVEHNVTQTGLANLTGVDQVKISRLINSLGRPNHNDLQGLFQVFTAAHDRWRLISAHIADEIPPEIFKTLKIQIEESNFREYSVESLSKLPKRVQSALKFLIRTHEENPSIGDVIVDLATMLDWKEVTFEDTQKLGKKLITPDSQKDIDDKVAELLTGKKISKSVRYPASKRAKTPP